MLLNQHPSGSSYVGPSVNPNPHFGSCTLDNKAQHPYDHTEMARHFPTFVPSSLPALPSPSPSRLTYFTARSVTLLNGDSCRIGGWVFLYLSAGNTEAPSLGRIHEIIVSADVALTQRTPRPDAILLQLADIVGWAESYQMPRISISNNWAVADVMVSTGSLSDINTFLVSYSRFYVVQTFNINAAFMVVSHQVQQLFIKNGRQQIKHVQSSYTTTQKT